MSPSDQINSGLISVRQRSSPCAFCAGLIKLRRLGDNVSAASQIREAALRGDRSASRRQAVTFLLLLGCPTRTMSVCTAPRQQAPMPRPRPQWVGWQTTSGLADWQTGRLADWVSKGYVPLVCGVRPARCVGATRSSRVGNGDLHLSCAPSLSVSPHTIASFRLHALELHLAVTQMSLRFPRVGSLCHTPSSPSQS